MADRFFKEKNSNVVWQATNQNDLNNYVNNSAYEEITEQQANDLVATEYAASHTPEAIEAATASFPEVTVPATDNQPEKTVTVSSTSML